MFRSDADRLNFLLEAEADLNQAERLFVDAETSGDESQSATGAEPRSESDAEAQAAAEERPKYITNYIGSKQKLIDWIWAATPQDAESVADAFSGSSVVGYMYKSKGLAVHSLDRLAYCHHIARAIVENDNVKLSDEEIEGLMADGSGVKDFVRKNFKGLYFEPGVHSVIDIIRSNCDKLEGYKKDIALFALGKTCITGKGGFGHFGTTRKQDNRADNPAEFRERFASNCKRISELVFKGEHPCKAHHGDTRELIGKVEAEVAYFDPPYATHFSQTNYERAYHFIEGLMSWWEGKEIRKDTLTRQYDIPTEVTQSNAGEFFKGFLTAAKHIPHWLISYRDQAYPAEAEIKKIIAGVGRASRMRSRELNYMISAKHGENSQALERLFVCWPEGTKAECVGGEELYCAASDMSVEMAPVEETLQAAAEKPNMHTRVEGLLESIGNLQAESESATGDRRFPFILTHVGTNRNGDHFTPEELRQAASTAIGRKIDLSHSQEFRDIVGGIAESKYVEAGAKSHVACLGDLYTTVSEPARLAYKLMRQKIVSHVSMECDYQEGECSICGKRIRSKAEYCIHLKNFKGRDFKGKSCYEILHNITFTGMGLLDREGADPGAEIGRVASRNKQGGTMDKDKSKEAAQPPEVDEMSETELRKLAKSQQSEIERLTKEKDDLQKRLDESQAAHKSMLRKAKAEKLLSKWEEAGREFADDNSRTAEIERLMKMSDDAFAATEETVSAFAAGKKKNKPEEEEDQEQEPEGEDENDEEEKEKKKNPFPFNKKNKKAKAALNSEARRNIPRNSSDQGSEDLASRLTRGFMAAYKERSGQPGEE